MKRGFTLVEMLIVVVVLVTLMSITFRLSSVGDDQTRRSNTIARLQKLENCLSGYYAAFGTYPPVKYNGHPDFRKVNQDNGTQIDEAYNLSLSWYQESGNHGIGSTNEKYDWQVVEATCRVQPLAAEFLYPNGWGEYLQELQKAERDAGLDVKAYTDGYSANASALIDCEYAFKFGLMSFLLPRYMLMMCAGSDQTSQIFKLSPYWNDNNRLPSSPIDGTKFTSWSNIQKAMESYYRSGYQSGSSSGGNKVMQAVMMMPSQAACVRWLPNLAEACFTEHSFTFYGIQISENHRIDGSNGGQYKESQYSNSGLYSSSGKSSSDRLSGSLFKTDIVTMCDGWNHELYYYSPPPYQTYRLWSAGANGRTFPPWVRRDKLSSSQNKCVSAWISDDIANMSANMEN